VCHVSAQSVLIYFWKRFGKCGLAGNSTVWLEFVARLVVEASGKRRRRRSSQAQFAQNVPEDARCRVHHCHCCTGFAPIQTLRLVQGQWAAGSCEPSVLKPCWRRAGTCFLPAAQPRMVKRAAAGAYMAVKVRDYTREGNARGHRAAAYSGFRAHPRARLRGRPRARANTHTGKVMT